MSHLPRDTQRDIQECERIVRRPWFRDAAHLCLLFCNATPQFDCVPFGPSVPRDKVAVQDTKLILASHYLSYCLHPLFGQPISGLWLFAISVMNSGIAYESPIGISLHAAQGDIGPLFHAGSTINIFFGPFKESFRILLFILH